MGTMMHFDNLGRAACGAKHAVRAKAPALTSCARCRTTVAWQQADRWARAEAYSAAVRAAPAEVVAVLVREGATAPVLTLVRRTPLTGDDRRSFYELHGDPSPEAEKHVGPLPRYGGEALVRVSADPNDTRLGRAVEGEWRHAEGAKQAFESLVRGVRDAEAARDDARCARFFAAAADERARQLFTGHADPIPPALYKALDHIGEELGFSHRARSGFGGHSPSTLGCVTEEQARQILSVFHEQARALLFVGRLPVAPPCGEAVCS